MANIEPVSTAGALLTLGPALIAVGGIVVNNWLTSRGQRDRANQQALREAAGEFLGVIGLLADHARELIELLESDAQDLGHRLADEHRGYLEAWRQVRTRAAVVRVSGPVSVAAAAMELQYAVGRYADELDRWYSPTTGKPDTPAPSTLKRHEKDARQHMEAFESVIRGLTGFGERGPRWRDRIRIGRRPRAA